MCLIASVGLEECLSVRSRDRLNQVGSTLDKKRSNKLARLRHNLERVTLATDQLSLDDDLGGSGGCDRRRQQHSEREGAQEALRFPTAGRGGHALSKALVSRKTYFVS
jgi:hypothetical protein